MYLTLGIFIEIKKEMDKNEWLCSFSIFKVSFYSCLWITIEEISFQHFLFQIQYVGKSFIIRVVLSIKKDFNMKNSKDRI